MLEVESLNKCQLSDAVAECQMPSKWIVKKFLRCPTVFEATLKLLLQGLSSYCHVKIPVPVKVQANDKLYKVKLL